LPRRCQGGGGGGMEVLFHEFLTSNIGCDGGGFILLLRKRGRKTDH
jgi:hypothetical protein